MDLQNAKADLAEIVKRAETEGPQTLEVEGRATAAVISLAELRRLQERKPTFKELLLAMPSLEDVDLSRDQTPARDIDL
jgi:antitoxin Phd